MSQTLFKIVTLEVWSADPGGAAVPRMPIDHQDGFLHLSTRDQLEETLRLHFAGKGPLVLIAIDETRIPDGLRWEPSRRGQLFPHVYGEIPGSAIVWTEPMEVAADGTMNLPEQVG